VKNWRPSYILLGCLAVLLAVGAAVALLVSVTRTKELRAPIVLALPNCKGGVYTKPAAEPVDLFDDLGNDAKKRACDGTKGFQGEAILSGSTLTLRIHNSELSPMVFAHVRLILKPKHASSFQRDYRLEGKIAPLGDGEMRTTTNLDSRKLDSFSASVTWVYFGP
jgi:hypothetical protein